MAVTQQQKVSYDSEADATTHTLTVTEPVAGRLMVLVAEASAVLNTPSGWSLAVSATNDPDVRIFYRIAPASFGTSVQFASSFSCSASATFFEYSGIVAVSPLDQTASQPSADGTGTTATTSQADELAIGAIGRGGTTTDGNWSAWTNSFVEEHDLASSGGGFNVSLGVASRVLTATGTYTTAATPVGGSGPCGCIATFKADDGAVTGTLVETQANQTSTATGQLGYTGTLAEVQANETCSASGTVTVPGVTGSLAETQADQTAAAAGQLGYSGSVAVTQANQTAAAFEFLPTPAGKPLLVPAGAYRVTVTESGHQLNVPAGTHVVEVP